MLLFSFIISPSHVWEFWTVTLERWLQGEKSARSQSPALKKNRSTSRTKTPKHVLFFGFISCLKKWYDSGRCWYGLFGQCAAILDDETYWTLLVSLGHLQADGWQGGCNSKFFVGMARGAKDFTVMGSMILVPFGCGRKEVGETLLLWTRVWWIWKSHLKDFP